MVASYKLLDTLPTFAEMSETMSDLKSHGEKAAVLLGAAYLEQCLEQLLVAAFKPLTEAEHNGLFAYPSGGFLKDYSAKVRLCYAMGLIEPETRDALKLIGQIRNVFAHTLHKIGFDHELVVADCQKLIDTPFFVIKMSLDEPEFFKELLRTTSGKAFDIYTRACEALYAGLLGAILIQLGDKDHSGGLVPWLKGVDLGDHDDQ
jgi:hypothetical protein